ncbi:MAG: GTPase HflX [Chloroflexi bacterium]|nr:GTPase HflX [Chloroflexota bacterium]
MIRFAVRPLARVAGVGAPVGWEAAIAPKTIETARPREQAVVVGIEWRESRWNLDDSLDELAELAETAGVTVVGRFTQRLDTPNPATYVGKGKLDEIRQARTELHYDVVLFDEELAPGQQRHIEEKLDVKVLDRTALILDIFARRARTHEGRLQVELAQLEYRLPRLTRLWTHLSRQAVGGVGLRGPGETQLESDRREIRTRIGQVKQELDDVRTHRELHRAQRRRAAVPIIALVGYTNAGKSTLLNRLTDASVLAEDKLFATLDPTTRRLRLPSGQEALLTDTVGFIQKLPPKLVAAFRSTLEEITEAAILLHVLDITHPNAAEQADTVRTILGDLGAGGKPVITALNKIDRLGDGATPAALAEQLPLTDTYVPISALTGGGLLTLLERIDAILARDQATVTVILPFARGDLVQLIRERGQVKRLDYTERGIEIEAMVPARYLPQLAAAGEVAAPSPPARPRRARKPARSHAATAVAVGNDGEEPGAAG